MNKPSVLYAKRPNGVQTGYCIYGEQHLGSKPPMVVFNALGFVPEDWESILPELMKSRASKLCYTLSLPEADNPYLHTTVVFFDYRSVNKLVSVLYSCD